VWTCRIRSTGDGFGLRERRLVFGFLSRGDRPSAAIRARREGLAIYGRDRQDVTEVVDAGVGGGAEGHRRSSEGVGTTSGTVPYVDERRGKETAGEPPPAHGDALVILDREPAKFLFAAWRNVSILVWLAQADAPAVVRLNKAVAKVAAEYPNARSCVTVVSAGVPIPTDGEARARFVELLQRSAGQLACLAIIAEGKGFERSALLSFHTRIRLAATASSEMGFFEGIDGLESWLPERHRRTGIVLDPARLREVVQQAIDAANGRPDGA
jgi:hypothetical protein